MFNYGCGSCWCGYCVSWYFCFPSPSTYVGIWFFTDNIVDSMVFRLTMRWTVCPMIIIVMSVEYYLFLRRRSWAVGDIPTSVISVDGSNATTQFSRMDNPGYYQGDHDIEEDGDTNDEDRDIMSFIILPIIHVTIATMTLPHQPHPCSKQWVRHYIHICLNIFIVTFNGKTLCGIIVQ